MNALLKRLFCWLYAHWMNRFVNDKSDPLVKIIDVFASSCKYCLVIRWIMATAGITLFLCGHPIALVLVLAAWGLTAGEKYWLCDVSKKESADPPT